MPSKGVGSPGLEPRSPDSRLGGLPNYTSLVPWVIVTWIHPPKQLTSTISKVTERYQMGHTRDKLWWAPNTDQESLRILKNMAEGNGVRTSQQG